jgi:hypothetical protein
MTRHAFALLLAAAVLGFGAVAFGQSSGSSGGAVFATANGQNVVAQDGTKGAGDKNGLGSFSAIRSGSKLCYGLTVTGISTPLSGGVTLYKGTPNKGSIAVKLATPSRGSAATRSGCVSVSSSTLTAIFANPGNYSFNVADDDFHDSAIIGTLTGGGGRGGGGSGIADCGNQGMSVQAITAQGTSCTNARAIASAASSSSSCQGNAKSCTVRSFTCLLGQAGSELTLVHCENSDQTQFVRFELGS